MSNRNRTKDLIAISSFPNIAESCVAKLSLCLVVLYLSQTVSMCSTVSGRSHVTHSGGEPPDIRYP